ncbi:glutamine synthetase [Roseibaca sp. Y0-43]|uniref:glutamine synthetase n=1 Tax=Roseibaca sp. Y0-43 TaxID=2816854 RepID=UPI001D0C6C37|nr:glutamine synthetase [Roseibaca sp. Y0-43]MCC1481758.1 hypothetical protein [Roseibaca sp. Y0-43]
MTQKGGMNGVHQVHFWGAKDREQTIEEREYVGTLPTKLTEARLEALKRTQLIHAFYANAPDTRKLGKAKREQVIDRFLKSKRWQRIAERILEE